VLHRPPPQALLHRGIPRQPDLVLSAGAPPRLYALVIIGVSLHPISLHPLYRSPHVPDPTDGLLPALGGFVCAGLFALPWEAASLPFASAPRHRPACRLLPGASGGPDLVTLPTGSHRRASTDDTDTVWDMASHQHLRLAERAGRSNGMG